MAHAKSVSNRPPDEAETPPAIPIVGIGPGNPSYLTTKAVDIINTSDVLIGFDSVIGYIEDLTSANLLKCSYKTEDTTLEAFASQLRDGQQGAAVLMGDPNVSGHQFIEKIESVIDQPIEIIPGISSIQIAASRSRIALENAMITTLHKRGPLDTDLTRLSETLGDRHSIILPRPYDWMPERIAKHLVTTTKYQYLSTYLLEHLTLPDESITRTTLGSLADEYSEHEESQSAYADLTVMVILSQSH